MFYLFLGTWSLGSGTFGTVIGILLMVGGIVFLILRCRAGDGISAEDAKKYAAKSAAKSTKYLQILKDVEKSKVSSEK